MAVLCVGELAAWVRLKYSHLIFGAVASSAPVSAIADYDGYDPIVAKALAYPLVGGSPACHSGWGVRPAATSASARDLFLEKLISNIDKVTVTVDDICR